MHWIDLTYNQNRFFNHQLSSMKQSTSTVFMIQPVAFDHNSQTATTNAFQKSKMYEQSVVQQKALEEFKQLVSVLESNGIEVILFEDTPIPHTPDAIFPNNWISIQEDTINIYPMFTENRKAERRQDIIAYFQKYFQIKTINNYSIYEQQNQIVEGTGSMVLDHLNKMIYMCLSPRANVNLMHKIAEDIGYECIDFEAVDDQGREIYHTNVMMCIGTKFAVICLESIPNGAKRDYIIQELEQGGRALIEITMEQMYAFAGNMIELRNKTDELFLAMSTTAFNTLNPFQIYQIEAFANILHSPIPTIEYHGGGSVRCMLTEVFAQKK